MKKLLIVLMVVAMASFLFVGCFGTTPDIPDVDEDVAVTGVTLDKATLALTVGDAPVTLVATVAPATATETSVIWASSDKTIAIVAAGVVTPLNAGISAITATTVDGGFVATCVVTVTAEGEPLPTSTTPVIYWIDGIDLYSSDTQYINEATADDGILVRGFAPKYSEVNVYIGEVVVGTSTTYGLIEEFIVFVAEDSLGIDGAKTLYATATELGFAESAPSTKYAFILDVVAPEIASAVADSDDSFITVTFDEAVIEVTAEEANWEVGGIAFTITTAELTSDNKVVKLNQATAIGDLVGDVFTVSCSLVEDLAENPIPIDAPSVYVGVVKP